MRKLLMIGAVMLLSAGQASAAGINLSWNDCGTTGVGTLAFACNTNAGAPLSLVASFVPPANVNSFLGISAQIDINTGTALPDWWKHGTGLTDCRGTTGLATSFDFTSGPFTCVDFYAGQAAGGFAYQAAFLTSNRARFRIQCAVPIDNKGPVDSATEYYAFKANMLKSKTTGAGSCAGCTQEACIVLNTIQLYQDPSAGNDPEISAAQNQNYVTWQSATIANCPQSTPTRSTTWSKVKSLYR